MADTYFATEIQTTSLQDTELNAALEHACWMLEEEDVAGQKWCDDNGYDGYTSYASLDDLPTRSPSFAELAEKLQHGANAFAAARYWDLQNQSLKLDSLWVNILGGGGIHSGHIHPNSIISGTYYVRVPPLSGRLKLEDPRLSRMMGAPPILADAPAEHRRFVYITPKETDALFWESWLRHEVVAGQTEEARISISYNFSLS